MSDATMDKVFSSMSSEQQLRGVHLAGGEATLNMPVLKKALKYAQKHNVPVDYLETNCGWCDSFETGLNTFTELKDAGLEAVLISASLFHNEFIPFCRTRDGIEAALHVFEGRVIIWTQEIFSQLSRLDHNRTHTLPESMKILDLDYNGVWKMHSYLTPAGRAAETLTEGLRKYPAENFRGDNCRSCLGSTGHFHIDPHGNLYTGHCPGLSIANVNEDLHPSVQNMYKHKLYRILQEKGPVGLQEICPEFRADKNGYIHKCHLCLELRKELFRLNKYAELTPPEYYL